MEQITYDQLQEELYYEQMANGLKVYVLPKPGFNKTFATFTTNYGSIDNEFIPLGQKEYVKVTDGIAHFLEHKLFEKEDGDVFQQFSKQGASANAFTSFSRTAYLFSSTDQVEKNLLTLIDFVQEPYFSEQTVEKEKGIIGQEITMYDDNPDWRLYFGLIENMYQHHPVKIDIAGTIESIRPITKDMLYECYHTFYHPSNMLLFVVGPVDPKRIIDLVRKNQEEKDFVKGEAIQCKQVEEPVGVAKDRQVLHMNVQMSKCLVGLKAYPREKTGKEKQKNELIINVLLEMLFGRGSENYLQLYESGLIDDTFSFDFTRERDFGFAMIGGDTSDPDKLADTLKTMLLEAKTGQVFTNEKLERAKKKNIGTFLRAFNSPEYIANQFTRYTFNGMDLFQVVPILEEITLADIQAAATNFIEKERFTVCQVVPKK